MPYWIRAATLQIGTHQYSFDDLNFTFEIPFEDSDQLSTAKIQAYNLAPSTRNSIQKGQPVIVNAGYEGDIGAIFVGQVSTVQNTHSGTEWITQITATACLEEWLSGQVNKAYKQSITAKAILSDLLNIFGIEVGEFALKQDKTYPRGRVCKGKLRDVITEIVQSDCKSRFLVKNGRIVINDPGKGMKTGYLLTPSTGLLQGSGDKDDKQAAGSLDTQKDGKQKDSESPSKSRDVLLNYHLGPADEIQIQSPSLTGRFLIVRGKHVGSQSGDWKTQIEVKPV